MNTECSIVRDLLPLYAEDMVSDDTKKFIESHLDTCEECRKVLDGMKEPAPVSNGESESDMPLRKIRGDIRRKKRGLILLTVLLSMILIISAMSALTVPAYYGYTDNLITVTENDNQTITLTFREDVPYHNCEVMNDPDGQIIYTVSAYSNALNKLFPSTSRTAPVTIPTGGQNILVYYTANDGSDSVLLYNGTGKAVDFGMVVLPRLAMGYYIIIAAVALAVLVILKIVMRNSEKAGKILNILIPIPAAFIISHILVSGFRTETYSMVRDFFITVLMSFPVYAAIETMGTLIRRKKNKDAL